MSYLSAGYLLRTLMSLARRYIGLGRSTLIVVGSASIGIGAGGIVGSSAAIYRWTSREGGNPATAMLAIILPSLLNTLVVLAVSLFGVVHLILVHDLSKVQLVGFIFTILVLGFVVGMAALALRHRDRATATSIWIANQMARLRRKPFDPAVTRQSTHDLFTAWDALLSGAWLRPALGALLNVVFDMLTLFFLFVSTGQDVSPGVLLTGYGLPLLLGKMAFVIPGGVGVVEGSMVALYVGLGVPTPVAVVVVLGYRVISFWLPTLSGYPIAAYLERSRRPRSENQGR
jgi:uncharacterized protein (TIRG00374 family)